MPACDDYIRFQAYYNFGVGVEKIKPDKPPGNARDICRMNVNGDKFARLSEIGNYFRV